MEFDIRQLDEFFGLDVFYLKACIGFSLALLITVLAIPKIIRVSYRKHLMDVPGDRSSHSKKIPNLGGLGIFYAVTITSSICAFELFGGQRYVFLFACFVILMFIGLMDDILVVAPDKKLYAQILVALMISLGSNVRISNFFGVFGIFEIHYWVSIAITTVLFIILINAYNLIDGIDGLAGIIGIIISISYIYSFYVLGDLPMVVLFFCVLGSIIGFLYYNLSSKMKIFMGDTGSMFLGFIFIFSTLIFLDSVAEDKHIMLPGAPGITVAILIVPIIDTLCAVGLRLYKGVSPLRADKNHIHHKYLALGWSHLQVSLCLGAWNIIILIFAYYFKSLNILGPSEFLVVILLLGMLMYFFPYFLNRFIKTKD